MQQGNSSEQDFVMGLLLFLCFLMLALFIEEQKSRRIHEEAMARPIGTGEWRNS